MADLSNDESLLHAAALHGKSARPGRLCLFIGDISLGGGTERACSTLAETMTSAGWQVTILSMYAGSPAYFDLPAEVTLRHVWPGWVRMRWRVVQTFWRMRRFLKQNTFDAWVDAETSLTAYSTLALAGSGIRHVAWENFHLRADLGSAMRRLGRYCAVRWADQVVLLTQADLRDWHAHFGNLAKLVVVQHCLQIQTSAPLPDSQRDRVILAVGRLCQQKGFDLLLRSWATIASNHPGWIIRIVGSGEELGTLNALSTQLGLDHCVQWIPATPAVFSHYASARIYALSSRFEGFGLVLIEAMAHGLPIVAFDCHYGPAEIVQPGQTGQLVARGDLTAFAAELDRLIRGDALRQRMATASYAACYPYRKGGNQEQWLAVLEGRVPVKVPTAA
jgi:glycosyltransferase involved in cell wall biosynthesis